MWLSELTLQLIGFRLLALLLIVGIHGGGLAGAAVLLGDKGPRYDGRLTVSPFAHLDLIGTISMILFGLGWSKPVDIDAEKLRAGRFGLVLVPLAGFAGLLALAALLNLLVLPVLTTLSHSAGLTAAAFLRVAGDLVIWAALFSLVPVFPLAGRYFLSALGLRVPQPVERVLVAAVVLAAGSGVVHQFLGPAESALAAVVLGR